MATITAHTFLNASLRLAFKLSNQGRIEVSVGRNSYSVQYFSSGKIKGVRMRDNDLPLTLPRKMTLAIWHAAKSEGLLDGEPSLPTQRDPPMTLLTGLVIFQILLFATNQPADSITLPAWTSPREVEIYRVSPDGTTFTRPNKLDN